MSNASARRPPWAGDTLDLNTPSDVRVPLRATYPDQEEITTFNAITGWTVLGNDTINLTTDLNHITRTASLEFDKTDGLANTKLAGVYRTISALDLSRFGPDDELQFHIYISNKVDVDYAFVRLGTSVSHYNEWRVSDASITDAVWSPMHVALAGYTLGSLVGNGHNMSAIAYVVVGVAFDLETDALPNILWDGLRLASSRHVRT